MRRALLSLELLALYITRDKRYLCITSIRSFCERGFQISMLFGTYVAAIRECRLIL